MRTDRTIERAKETANGLIGCENDVADALEELLDLWHKSTPARIDKVDQRKELKIRGLRVLLKVMQEMRPNTHGKKSYPTCTAPITFTFFVRGTIMEVRARKTNTIFLK